MGDGSVMGLVLQDPGAARSHTRLSTPGPPHHVLAALALQVLDLGHQPLQLLASVLVQLIVPARVPQVNLRLLAVIFAFL